MKYGVRLRKPAKEIERPNQVGVLYIIDQLCRLVEPNALSCAS